MRKLILLFVLLISSFGLVAQEYVVFNDIWKSSGTFTVSSRNISSISAVAGSGYRFVSSASTFDLSKTGSNDVTGTLSYTNNGSVVSYSGTVVARYQANGNIIGFLFVTGSEGYALVVPGFESEFAAGNNKNGNSGTIVTDLNDLKSTQSATVILNITNAPAEIESDSRYSTFELSFSKNRGTNNSVSFTPSLINGTAIAGNDFTSSIEFTKSLTAPITWSSAASGVSVAFNENTVYLRVPLKNDNSPECQEQFVLQTGIFTGAGATEISNFEGVFGTAKISDDNDPLTWTGATSTDWDVSGNYDFSLAPDSCYCITLPSSPSGGRDPLVSSSSTKNNLKNLTINSGGKISIGNGATLKVTGDVAINNAVDGVSGDGTLELNGTSNQNITGNGVVKNIKINNAAGITIGAGSTNKLNVKGVLNITSGTITTNDNLVFKASETEEGMIGQISTCATNATPIIGKVTVERYIPGSQRSFRFLTPGVTSTSSIRDNWQEGANVTNPQGYPNLTASSANPLPGYGTHITGSTSGENGVDATITGNPSMFTYSALNQTWSAITNTTSPTFKVGEAYQIMVRGDRSIDMRTNTPNPNTTIIRTTGTPATCNFTFTPSTTVPLSSSATGFSFIGNPYWAIVNWHTVSKSGIENTFYYWDPTLSGTGNRGAYATLSLDGNGSETRSNNISRISKFLQPGQGFFVRNTTTTPSITFTENDKVNNNSNKALIFQKNPLNPGAEIGVVDQTRIRGNAPATEKIYLSLYLKNNINTAPADGLALTYNRNFSDAAGPEDARKFSNLDENIAVALNGARYAITGMQASAGIKSDTIPVTMWNLNDQDYVIRFSLTDYLEPQREIFLLNRTTGQTTKLPNNGTLDYEFRPSVGIRTKDDLAIVFNSTKIIPAPRTRKRVEIFPNPVSTGVVQFSIPTSDTKSAMVTRVNIEVQDQAGRLVSGGVVSLSTNGTGQLDVSDLPAGIYSFKIYVDGKVFINKIMKQ